jgi:signal transduction histidine kinase
VRLRRRNSGQELLVEVNDDGVGFDASASQTGHLGLRTMAQRMEQLGGVLVVDTGPGRGTRVSATIPLTPSGSRLAAAASTSPASDVR